MYTEHSWDTCIIDKDRVEEWVDGDLFERKSRNEISKIVSVFAIFHGNLSRAGHLKNWIRVAFTHSAPQPDADVYNYRASERDAAAITDIYVFLPN